MSDDDIDDALISEAIAALPARFRRPILKRMIAAHQPPEPAWQARQRRLDRRDELVRDYRAVAFGEFTERSAAKLMARALGRAAAVETPSLDAIGQILSLNDGEALGESQLRRIIAGERTGGLGR